MSQGAFKFSLKLKIMKSCCAFKCQVQFYILEFDAKMNILLFGMVSFS